MLRAALLSWFLFALATPVGAQAGFQMPRGRQQVDIPFEYVNNFIILNVNFGGFLPLKFIFDTGAENTILTKRQISDLMRVTYEREFRVTGSDLKTILIAYLVRRIRFDIADKMTAPAEDILVLQEDYFRFEEYAGINVHGILAAMAFSRFIIKIDYDRQLLTLYERNTFNPGNHGYTAVPVELFRNKIYLNTALQILPDSVARVKLLIDTGAGLPLLLFNNTHPLVHPPANALNTNIGMGLGGYLEGYTGRVHGVELGDFQQKSVVTYFQTLDTALSLEQLNYRNGLIGNTILSRFQVILDYQNAQIWLKPGRSFQKEFVYDRSGLSLIATGPKFSDIIVQNVLPGSPAEEADIRRGDEIVGIRRTPAGFFTLSDIQQILQKKPGKRIHIKVKRDGQRLKKTIVLRDLI